MVYCLRLRRSQVALARCHSSATDAARAREGDGHDRLAGLFGSHTKRGATGKGKGGLLAASYSRQALDWPARSGPGFPCLTSGCTPIDRCVEQKAARLEPRDLAKL
jgi:hypothetical protein